MHRIISEQDSRFSQFFFKATLLTMLVSCNPVEWHPRSPIVTGELGIEVTVAIDIDEDERPKIEQAISLLARVLNDATFWSAVSKGPDRGEVQKALDGHKADAEATSLDPERTYAWNIVDKLGKRVSITNTEIVSLLKLAHEPGGSRDQVVEFAIRRNHRPWAPWCGWPFYREIGHRESPNIIMTQDCKMSRMSAQDLAGHWLHEYMHMLGFDHAYEDDPARRFSVPYFVGDIAVQRAYALDGHVAE